MQPSMLQTCVYRQFLGLRSTQVNYPTLYIQVCAYPNHVWSTEFTTGRLQSSCGIIWSMMIRNRSSILSVLANYICMFFLIFIHLRNLWIVYECTVGGSTSMLPSCMLNHTNYLLFNKIWNDNSFLTLQADSATKQASIPNYYKLLLIISIISFKLSQLPRGARSRGAAGAAALPGGEALTWHDNKII